MFVKSAFNYDKRANSLSSALVIPDDPEKECLTKQEFKEECDINTLLRRFAITGQMPEGVRLPVYGDFEQINDFHSAANAIAMASESFDAMPAEIRERFSNDPEKFVAFCLDDRNREEARKWGLVPPAELEAAQADLGAATTTSTAPTAAPPAGGTPPPAE